MTDMGETGCMDMIEKLNEEHDETLTENVRLTNELEELKDKVAGISTMTCDSCCKTKKEKWNRYDYISVSEGCSLDYGWIGKQKYKSEIKEIKICEECRIENESEPTQLMFGSPFSRSPFVCYQRLTTEMTEWEKDFIKLKSDFTPRLVKKWEQLMSYGVDLRDSNGGDPTSFTKYQYPCFFRDGGAMQNYVYQSIINS
jgi:hypothetical protein